MKKNKLYVLIICFLLVLNVYSFIRFNNLNRINELSTEKSIKIQEIQNYKLDTYLSNHTAGILNNGNKIDSNHLAKDSLHNSSLLKNIFENEQKNILVFRFSKMHCESCIIASMDVLKKQIDSIGKNNILFLGNYRNNRIYQRTVLEYGVNKVKVYNSNSFSIQAEEIGYPYFFILKNNLEISDIFIPNKITPNITDRYLKMIHEKYFHE